MTLQVDSDTINQQVTFTSKNTTDPTSYTGQVMGAISYALAGNYGDVVSYTAAVQRADSSVGDANTLNYFLIALSNGQAQPTIVVFADEWISPGSFSVVQQKAVIPINVFDMPSAGADAIITLLRANGYNAVLIADPAKSLAIAQGTTTLLTQP